MRFVSCGAGSACFADPCSVPAGVWVVGDRSCPELWEAFDFNDGRVLSSCSPGRGDYPAHSSRTVSTQSVPGRACTTVTRSIMAALRLASGGVAPDARLSRSLRGSLAGEQRSRLRSAGRGRAEAAR
jgi:hypothetical protein